MPIWEKLVFCSVSSAWADFWRLEAFVWLESRRWAATIVLCPTPMLSLQRKGRNYSFNLHSQPEAGKCYNAFAKWMCLGLQSQSSIRKQLHIQKQVGWEWLQPEQKKEWLLLNSCQEMPFNDGSVISATSYSNVTDIFLCDYAEFLQYCCLTTLNHFSGLQKQAHIGQM